MMDLNGTALRVFIMDVSYQGMKLSVPEDIPVGTAVMISVMDVKVPAIVHWSHSRFAGIHLLQRLESDTLRALESAHDALAAYR